MLLLLFKCGDFLFFFILWCIALFGWLSLDVSFQYKSRPDHVVLDQINLRIAPKGLTAIAGKSGSGKSTIMSILAGLHQPVSGLVTVHGVDISRASRTWLRHQVGYCCWSFVWLCAVVVRYYSLCCVVDSTWLCIFYYFLILFDEIVGMLLGWCCRAIC